DSDSDSDTDKDSDSKSSASDSSSSKSEDKDLDAKAAKYKGAQAAAKDGSAQGEGKIKGNEDSMLYHVPGSQWYDATIAEFYFNTPEEAEAAGFKPAGGKDAQSK
ncbi:MAG: 50S ribosomal protein L17, partial [Micrococcaceae bacterium]